MRKALFLCLFGLAVINLQAQTVLYESNSLGLKGRLLGPDSGNDGFVLQQTVEGDSVEEILFENGKEMYRKIKNLYPDGSVLSEDRFENGDLVEQRVWDPRGLPVSIVEYSSGKEQAREDMTYQDNLLLSRVLTRDEESVEFLYNYLSDGSLYSILTIGPGVESGAYYYGVLTSLIHEEFIINGPRVYLRRYNRNGRLKSEHNWEGLGYLKYTEFEYKDGQLYAAVVSDMQSGEIEQILYDEQGNEISSNTRGQIEVKEERFYNDEKQLIKLVRQFEGVEEVSDYQYNADDSIRLIEIRINNQLSKSVNYLSEDEYDESFYENENLWLIRRVKEGRVIRESFYAEGVLLRERSID